MGISGQTTGEILERFERECIGRVQEGANNIIIIASGINDSRYESGTVRASELVVEEDMRELICRAKAKTDSVLCVGLTPVDEARTTPLASDKTMSWRNENIVRYDAIIRELAEEQEVEYVDVWGLIDPKQNADGLHPGEAGHEAIAAAVLEHLEKHLK
mgnify:CR=1 FL=1